jgi:phosphatidylinositol alpha-1,6-mannosyltransferase
VPETVAFVVGSGPEEARLKALAAELQIQDAVIFAGFVPESELPAYYAVADLYLHTCKLESFGLSVLEASAAGVTVVAVGEGGPCEIIADGETGVLVPAVPEGIAATAVALLRDPARRRALGAAARLRVAQNYAWTRGAQTFLEIVRQM